MMKQGSDEWFQARCGKVTASKFKDVMTLPRSNKDKDAGKLSQTAESYLLEVVGEIITGKPVEVPTTRAMQWGDDHEPEARIIYGDLYDVTVEQHGFDTWKLNDRVGLSPDGSVVDCAATYGIEIKCPYTTREHLRHVLNGVPSQYEWQVYAGQLILGWQWTDFISYDPRFDDRGIGLHVVRVPRNESKLAALEDTLLAFCDKIDDLLERLK